jgi:hypothetical protein
MNNLICNDPTDGSENFYESEYCQSFNSYIF